jgi:putative ABC transport system permease protein
MRAVATVLAIALEVTLILVVVGLTNGMLKDSARRMQGTGADIVFLPPGSSYFLGASTAVMPVKIKNKLLTIKGVHYVAPILLQTNTQGGLDIIYGIDLASFNEVSQGFIFLGGSEFRSPHDVIVDDIYAASRKLKVGDETEFLNHSFRVCGVVEHGKGSRIFLPIQALQELMGRSDRASLMFIKCESPEVISQVTSELKKQFIGYKILPMSEFVSVMSSASSSLPALRVFINSVTFIAVLVGFFAIFLAMYTAIIGRTREIGILKSLGASKPYVLIVFMKEAMFLCALGFLVGIGLSQVSILLLQKVFSSLQVEITGIWIIQAAIVAFTSAGLGALYPALRAASQDPVEALAYE